MPRAEGPKRRQPNNSGGWLGCEQPEVESCTQLWEQPHTPTHKGATVGRGRGHKRPHPGPGLEAYLSPQTNAKEKADVGWGWEDLSFLAGDLIGKTKGLSIHCADTTGVLPNSELGRRLFILKG